MIVGFPTSRDEVTFKYTAFGGSDQIDQILDIHNDGLHAIRPTLEITPLDANHQPIPGVTVTTAFGSDRGAAGDRSYFTDFDILHFEGARAGDVRDVRVRITKLKQAKYPEMSKEVTIDRYEGGVKVEDFDEQFDSVQLTNPNGDELSMKVVLIAWRATKKGTPQQFDWSIPIGPPVEVPAHGTKTVKLPSDLADISGVSVKTYSATSGRRRSRRPPAARSPPPTAPGRARRACRAGRSRRRPTAARVA